MLENIVNRLTKICLSVFVLSIVCTDAFAQSYPDRPLKIVVSYGPGGGSDIQARLIGQNISDRLKQPVLVENRPGGNGVIGMRAAATSKPDGYTLYWGSSDHVIMGPSTFSNYPFDPLKDFVPVSIISSQPYLIVVPATVPARTLTEFIALAKSRPGQLNFGSTGTGGLAHLAGEVMQKVTGIRMVHVPFKGAAEANAGLIGDQVQLQFAGVATITPLVKSGAVRAIGVTSAERLAAYPDLPTMTEAGFPDLVISSWNGIFLPAGTPPEIVNAVYGGVAHALRQKETLDRLSGLGLQTTNASPVEFSKFIKTELDKWDKNIKSIGMEKQPM